MIPSDEKLIFAIIIPILLFTIFAYCGGTVIIPTLIVMGLYAATSGHHIIAMLCMCSLAFSLFYRFEKRRVILAVD